MNFMSGVPTLPFPSVSLPLNKSLFPAKRLASLEKAGSFLFVPRSAGFTHSYLTKTRQILPMVSATELLDIGREAFWVTLMVAGPAMLAGLAIGFVIALLQALTQVQEMTLVFVPRIIVMFLVLSLALPFMGAVLGQFALKLYAMIANGSIPAGI